MKQISQTGMPCAPETAVKKIGFFVTPEFSPLGVLGAIEALRIANRLAGKPLYGWDIVSLEGEPVKSANGLTFMAGTSLPDATGFDLVFICAGFFPENFCDEKTLNCVRKLERHGTSIGAICTGTEILAKAGIIKDRKCTIHSDHLPGLREAYPKLEIVSGIYSIDRGLFTCAGGTSAIDLFVQLIAIDHGEKLAVAAAHELQHDRIRKPEDPQSKSKRMGLRLRAPKLARALDLMEQNIETPLTSNEIAGKIGITQRQLQRIFQKQLGRAPVQIYTKLRLDHSRSLLLQTELSIIEIAVASGFGSHGQFSKRYRAAFGYSPHFERITAK